MSQYEDFKQKRYDHTLEIRKNLLQQKLNKRRNIEPQGQPLATSLTQSQLEEPEPKAPTIVDSRYFNQIEELINQEYDQGNFDELAEDINSVDVMRQHRGVIGMRKLLAKNVDPPIKKFIDKGLTNKCLWLAKQKEFPQIKLESTWILTNVASGEAKFCDRLVQRGGIDLFVSLLQENEKGIVDQAIWGIGNIAADNVKHRDMILKKGGMEALVKIIENSKSKAIIRNGAWAVTNLCRGVPHPEHKYIKEACPLLCKVIKSGALKGNNNKEILADVVSALSQMTQGSKSRIERVNQAQILKQIFQYVYDPFKGLYIPALKILGNFSNGNENHTDELIKHGIFDLALRMLDHPKKPIRKQMCWILSNIAAGVPKQVNILMSRVDLLDKIALMFHQEVPDIQREICWIYGNLGHLGERPKLLEICLHYDVMRIFANLLHSDDTETLENVLETLYKVLFVGMKCEKQGKNLLLLKFLDYGGASRLEDLQMHKVRGVYDKTIRILTKFFQLEQNTI